MLEENRFSSAAQYDAKPPREGGVCTPLLRGEDIYKLLQTEGYGEEKNSDCQRKNSRLVSNNTLQNSFGQDRFVWTLLLTKSV